MSEVSKTARKLDAKRSKEIEEELYATLRKQVERMHPVQLPFSEFWRQSGDLLDHIEGELNNSVRAEGHTLRSHTASKRQANVRRALTELARKRLVALLNHAVTTNLRPMGEIDSQNIPSLDWNKHDSSEKQFYNQCVRLVESFKASVDWTEMHKGAGISESIPKVESGTKQLDEFIEQPGGLTGRGPPPLEILMKEEKVLDEFDEDEEERIARVEGFPEMMEMANQSQSEQATTHYPPDSPLIPSGKDTTLEEMISVEPTSSNLSPEPLSIDVQEPDEPALKSVELLRIRILESSEEPIITAEGEIDLEAGDVHQLEEQIADYLIQAGVAEAAPL
ncbi:MAG: hypothetical protein QGF72_04665 [Candidatus Poseidoniaceae archaeon]|jgi:hypothetical protein|nr:hypothetical protein [Candidatus Poseidoniaceae archaeon]|tara:strand:+ start:379 stop:1386 length:1008 start_codon:yes stop_codon:yes gene_type:complete